MKISNFIAVTINLNYMRSITVAFLALFSTIPAFAQYNDPNIAKPTTGYGSDGTHPVDVISFPNSYFSGQNVQIFHPSDISTKVPTIFYSHAYGGFNSTGVSGLLNFAAKKGYAIVFVPYQTTGVTVLNRYENLLTNFRKAARDYPSIIDTTRVGFLGYSFGGGASFGNAYTCFTENNWGSNGRFIYALAQWYSYNISQANLQAFPANTKLLVEIFNDDETNDHRMAVDIFNNISIPAAEKDFLLLKSDTINGYAYIADHGVPGTVTEFDALDYYGIYRLLDAMCDYTFTGSLAAKNVALGNGNANQVTMPGGLKNLVQTDNPTVVYPESKYLFPCSDVQNLRSNYCPQILGLDELMENNLSIWPNPASDNVHISLPEGSQVKTICILTSDGRLVSTVSAQNKKVLEIETAAFTEGIYFVIAGESVSKLVIEKP